jgi:hypothetical protein
MVDIKGTPLYLATCSSARHSRFQAPYAWPSLDSLREHAILACLKSEIGIALDLVRQAGAPFRRNLGMQLQDLRKESITGDSHLLLGYRRIAEDSHHFLLATIPVDAGITHAIVTTDLLERLERIEGCRIDRERRVGERDENQSHENVGYRLHVRPPGLNSRNVMSADCGRFKPRPIHTFVCKYDRWLIGEKVLKKKSFHTRSQLPLPENDKHFQRLCRYVTKFISTNEKITLLLILYTN